MHTCGALQTQHTHTWQSAAPHTFEATRSDEQLAAVRPYLDARASHRVLGIGARARSTSSLSPCCSDWCAAQHVSSTGATLRMLASQQGSVQDTARWAWQAALHCYVVCACCVCETVSGKGSDASAWNTAAKSAPAHVYTPATSSLKLTSGFKLQYTCSMLDKSSATRLLCNR